MLQLEKTSVYGFEEAIRGMRNPMNSWDKSDSGICKGGDDGIGCSNCADFDCQHTYDHSFQLGKNDFELMTKLRNAGTDHRKFMRMIVVYIDITAPLYWWKEFDTYKVGTVANSCSTMHKITEKEFTLDDFSCEHLLNEVDSSMNLKGMDITTPFFFMQTITDALNHYRRLYLEVDDQLKNDLARKQMLKLQNLRKTYWWQMIQLLPSSYNQKRTVMLNYEVLANIYKSRRNHKLDEWHTFCYWIESLPHSELITGPLVMKKDDSWIDKFNAIGNVNPISSNELKICIDLANGKDFTSNGKENDNG